MFFCNILCGILSSSSPVIAKSLPLNMPKSFAIAFAVIIWSPVIITVFIPAFLQVATASFTPSLGGSIIPINPIKIRFFSTVSVSILLGKLGMSKYAIANTLKASSAILLFWFSISLVFE